MSWLFSRALVEAYLEESSSDGEPSAPLSGKPTPQAYCAPDKMTAFSRLSRFGMTFKPLTPNRGEELLMSYLAAFRAKTSQPQDEAQELRAREAECGSTWRGWLAKYDPNSCSWRTAQCSFIEDLEQSLVTFPASGMTVGGLCWELPMLGRHTSETGSGLWPTPISQDAKHSGYAQSGPGMAMKLSYAVVKYPTPQSSDHITKRTSEAWKARGAVNFSLANPEIQAKWGTPKAQDSRHALWDRGKGNLGEQVAGLHDGGKLNPTWVEWLMMWPLGWTDLKPLETDKFLSAPQQPGDS